MSLITGAIFFGSNYRVAQSVNRVIPLAVVVAEKRSFNRDIYNFCFLNGIDFQLFQKDSWLLDMEMPSNCVGVSCGFSFIFQHRHIESFKHGIWNIHYGKLPEIRGRHPLSWGFIRGDQEFGLTIHEINTKIDQGYILAQGTVLRDLNDTQAEIEEKFEQLLEKGLFEEAMKNYLAGAKDVISKGGYYESLAGKLQQIQPEEYDSLLLFNIFQSQFVYGGVSVVGKTYTRCEFYNSDFPLYYEEFDLFTCRDGQMVALK